MRSLFLLSCPQVFGLGFRLFIRGLFGINTHLLLGGNTKLGRKRKAYRDMLLRFLIFLHKIWHNWLIVICLCRMWYYVWKELQSSKLREFISIANYCTFWTYFACMKFAEFPFGVSISAATYEFWFICADAEGAHVVEGTARFGDATFGRSESEERGANQAILRSPIADRRDQCRNFRSESSVQFLRRRAWLVNKKAWWVSDSAPKSPKREGILGVVYNIGFIRKWIL